MSGGGISLSMRFVLHREQKMSVKITTGTYPSSDICWCHFDIKYLIKRNTVVIKCRCLLTTILVKR